MIAEGEAEDVHAKISERIAYPINPLAPRKAQTKTSAYLPRIGQEVLNRLDRAWRQFRIRVEKP